ncbi:alanyl-tRNA synthetase [Anaerobranca californiensis DSM 14826]|uniref:Alanyl-tRNA synthetase n=1 Tax=Anaerobranca californiensis DSM 14826 TaxID=1120989 RepID=A0A1M6RPD0_9FIRM|nr:DHHA1 domain-containing protein [Anaerobranca californiensis]SHK34303.1 alanyl-tRNA synthetase [Anaerobranca californiensis DSM 14826]
MTEKFYLVDSYLTKFTAKVLEKGVKDGLPYVVLDKTAFYPEGGGQPWDTGWISGKEVVKVLEEDGKVYHFLIEAIEGEIVGGEIDWQWRFDHMQQHLGQHILSGAFEKILDGETVGFHLGKEKVTIDINIENITDEDLALVEEEANKIVFKNLLVKNYYVTEEEVKKLPLRKPPKVEDNIRIVEVDAYDYSGCGGTHPKRTGEVGIIKIIRKEKVKGNTRIEFLCGHRALKDYHFKNQCLLESSALLSRPHWEIVEGIEKLFGEINILTKENKGLKEQLLFYKGEEMYQKGEKIGEVTIVEYFTEGENIKELSLLSSIITEKERVVTLFVNKGEKTGIIFAQSKDLELDMNHLLKEILPIVEGSGGGNKYKAQGGTTATKNLDKILPEAKKLLYKKLIQG